MERIREGVGGGHSPGCRIMPDIPPVAGSWNRPPAARLVCTGEALFAPRLQLAEVQGVELVTFKHRVGIPQPPCTLARIVGSTTRLPANVDLRGFGFLFYFPNTGLTIFWL